MVLLIYFCSLKIEKNKQLLFKPEPKQYAKKIPYCWDITFLILNLPERVVSNIHFAHTINGCDATSHLHYIKKKLPLKLLSTSDTSLKAAAEFNDTNNSKDSIIHAGEAVVTQLYKTGFQGSLNQLGIEQFEKKGNAFEWMQRYRKITSFIIIMRSTFTKIVSSDNRMEGV